MDASIFDSALSHTRRSNASEKAKKIACPFFDAFAFGQVSSRRLYRLSFQNDQRLLKRFYHNPLAVIKKEKTVQIKALLTK